MWTKIKTAFSVIGAVLSIALFTVLLFLLRRSQTNRRGSGDDSERNQRVEEGIGKCEERAATISEGIDRAKNRIGRCEEHLQRAEDILRNAIKRSREGEPEA